MSRAYKVVLTLFTCLLFAGKAHVQEVKHAPTIEQCRADQRLWWDKLQRLVGLPEYEILDKWSSEMLECASVDADNKLLYHHVICEINANQTMRLEKFLNRHGMYAKFIGEDKEGKNR